jgi:hypothetical protein
MIRKTYKGGEMVDTEKYVDEALKLYLRELPEDSETAKAIRRGAARSEISQTAEKEGLHYISAGIFIAEEERFAKLVDPGISDVVAARVQEIRKHLPNSCETAAAIDRSAPWSEVSQIAQRDGLHEIASLVFEAEQEGMED